MPNARSDKFANDRLCKLMFYRTLYERVDAFPGNCTRHVRDARSYLHARLYT